MSALVNHVAYTLTRARDGTVAGLARFIQQELHRCPADVLWFSIRQQPGLCYFELVFQGDAPHECIYGYMWQMDSLEWRVYQWERHYQERFF